MKIPAPYNQSNYRTLLTLSTLLLPLSLLLNLGVQPLLLEEPRRGLVAMEMIASGNPWVPRLFGELYYNKPPMFNWLLIGSASIFGALNEWAIRLPTILSLLGIGALVYAIGKRYVDATFGWLAALLTVCSVDFLFYFSMLGEIDLFYSLVSLAGIFSVFHFHQQQKPYLLFPAVYLLAATGFLTKGLPSILFTGITLIAYLWYRKDLKLLFSPAHFLGGFLFLALTGGYYWIYSRYADPWPFLENLWQASANRSVLENSWLALPRHVLTFPLDTLKNLLPAAFLLPFALHRNNWKHFRKNELVVFCLLAFTANYLVYWISPGSRQRYVYMLYPLAIIALTWFYYQYWDYKGGRRFLQIVGITGSGILALAAVALPFFPNAGFPDVLLPVTFSLALLAGGMFFYLLPRSGLGLPAILFTLILARLLFDVTVLPQRAADSGSQRERRWAREIADFTDGKPLHLVRGHRAPWAFTFYLNQTQNSLLHTTGDYHSEGFYILDNQEPPGWETIMDFDNRENCYYFGRFTEPPPAAFFEERLEEEGAFRE